MTADSKTYPFVSSQPTHMHEIFVQPVLARLRELRPLRVLDLGCGNGSLCCVIRDAGFQVDGCDVSEQGIQQARAARPDIPYVCMSIYDEPPQHWLGQFDVIVSTEVIEHLYDPRAMPRLVTRLLRPGGVMLVTTPYHGYLKNLALSLLNKWDQHHTPFWLHGHIKFWSRKTLTQLFEEEGLQFISFKGLGRIPWLWMTMLLEFKSPKPRLGE